MFAVLHQWHRLSLVKRGHLVHAETDPACKFHRPPRPGSRLDRASRGVSCPRCIRVAARCANCRHREDEHHRGLFFTWCNNINVGWMGSLVPCKCSSFVPEQPSHTPSK